MRKASLLLIIVALVLALSGCCTKFNPDSGEVSKTFMNCVEKWKESGTRIICSWSAEEIAEAGNAARFLQVVFGPGYSAAIDRAIAVFLNIHTGLCASEVQVEDSLATLDVAVVTTQVAAEHKKAKAPAVPDVSALRKRVK